MLLNIHFKRSEYLNYLSGGENNEMQSLFELHKLMHNKINELECEHVILKTNSGLNFNVIENNKIFIKIDDLLSYKIFISMPHIQQIINNINGGNKCSKVDGGFFKLIPLLDILWKNKKFYTDVCNVVLVSLFLDIWANIEKYKKIFKELNSYQTSDINSVINILSGKTLNHTLKIVIYKKITLLLGTVIKHFYCAIINADYGFIIPLLI
jgi:hypothetical protein